MYIYIHMYINRRHLVPGPTTLPSPTLVPVPTLFPGHILFCAPPCSWPHRIPGSTAYCGLAAYRRPAPKTLASFLCQLFGNGTFFGNE